MVLLVPPRLWGAAYLNHHYLFVRSQKETAVPTFKAEHKPAVDPHMFGQVLARFYADDLATTFPKDICVDAAIRADIAHNLKVVLTAKEGADTLEHCEVLVEQSFRPIRDNNALGIAVCHEKQPIVALFLLAYFASYGRINPTYGRF